MSSIHQQELKDFFLRIFLPKQSLQHLYWTMNEKHREDYKDDGEDEDDHEEDSMEEEERGYNSDET